MSKDASPHDQTPHEQESEDWEFCKVLSRMQGQGLRVLEKNGEMYRERVLEARDGLEDIKGEVYG